MLGAAVCSLSASSALLLWNTVRKWNKSREIIPPDNCDSSDNREPSTDASAWEDIALFYAGSTSISWGLGASLERMGTMSSIAYMAGPALTAVLINRVRTGQWMYWARTPQDTATLPERIVKTYTSKNAWRAALLVPAFTVGVALLPPLLFPEHVQYSASGEYFLNTYVRPYYPEAEEAIMKKIPASTLGKIGLAALTAINGLLAAAVVNMPVTSLEEVGWRGFLLPRLQKLGFGPWSASYISGALWGLWHAVIVLHGHNYPIHCRIGVPLFTLFGALASPLFTFALENVEEECRTMTASLLHGMVNAFAGLSSLLVKGGSDLTNGAQSASGLFLLGLGNLAYWLYRSRWSSSTSSLSPSSGHTGAN